MFYKLGLLIVTRARLVLALGLVALVISAILGVGVFSRLLSGGFDDPASASSRAQVLLDQKFGGEPDMIFLVRARDGNVASGAGAASGQALAKRLDGDPRLTGVTSYWATRAPGLRSRDGSEALILARVAGDDAQAASNATALLAAYAHLDNRAVTVRIGGALGTDIGGQVGKDLAVAESIAVPVTLVLLVIAFGSIVSALLPLAVAVAAIFGTLAELSLLTHVTSVSIFAINLTTALGLGLGIDYALLMVSRFREELSHGGEVGEAVARTTATAGRTVAFSALTVAVALSAMLVFPIYFLRSFAYAGVGVTVLAAASALLVLPAALAVLGHRVNAGHVPGIRPVRSAESPFWGRLAAGVMRRPIIAAAPVIAVLLLLATPLLKVTFGTPDDRVLPTSAASHQVGDILRNDFATKPDVIDLVITPAASQPALRSYALQLSRIGGVHQADSSAGSFTAGKPAALTPGAGPARLAASGSQRLTLSTGLDPASGAAQDLVQKVRQARAPAGTTVLVGGSTATLVDAKHAISSRLPLASGIIVVMTFLLLFLVHRQRRPAGPCLARQRPHPRRHARDNGVDLPRRPSRARPSIHPDSDQHRDAGAAVLHRVRAVHGLRDVLHEPDQGAARHRLCQRLRRHPRPGPRGQDRIDRSRPARRQLLRLRHQPGELHPVLRHRHRAGDTDRRDPRARSPGPGVHASLRRGQLVRTPPATPAASAHRPERARGSHPRKRCPLTQG
jgi:putative drug exporter of the RND superfamily